jgi:hypothetical protein
VDLTTKLQIKPGQRIAVLGRPEDLSAEVAATAERVTDPNAADVVVAFVRTSAELDSTAGPALDAARQDKLSWIAYPKAGKLGTDLNRDVLRESLVERGVQPVRQVAIDDVWSALRFRPA